jgi:3-methyladenine DNA glycosylase AlkC
MAMKLLSSRLEKDIDKKIIENIVKGKYNLAVINVGLYFDKLYKKIPSKKRISYGRVHVIKILSKYIFDKLSEKGSVNFEVAADLYGNSNDFKSKGVSLGIISFCGVEEPKRTLPYFVSAADSPDFDTREMAQMFFRKIIKEHPSTAKKILLNLVGSSYSNIRRFVAETLRPVKENKWFHERPEYPLSILRNLFKENSPYPRTSVGNNLSDLSKQNPELVYKLVEELVGNRNENSYWIAYRACRNLAKKDKNKVMKLLKVDEYIYKNKTYKRSARKRS